MSSRSARALATLVLLPLLPLAACTAAPAPPPAAAPPAEMSMPVPLTAASTDADMIRNAMAAAPEAVSKFATILTMDEKMNLRTLREGTNGWTCVPDTPESPGIDPMCVDKNGGEWMMAWMNHKDPPKEKLGFAYMLVGGSDASNTDPFASSPAGGSWIDTGPHVMVFNITGRFDGYPTTPDNPKAPYVMWAGTPYAHLMLPIK